MILFFCVWLLVPSLIVARQLELAAQLHVAEICHRTLKYWSWDLDCHYDASIPTIHHHLCHHPAYPIVTGVGLTPWTNTHNMSPKGAPQSPYLWLLVTLPLAPEVAHEYCAFALYPVRFLVINFANHNLLTTPTAY